MCDQPKFPLGTCVCVFFVPGALFVWGGWRGGGAAASDFGTCRTSVDICPCIGKLADSVARAKLHEGPLRKAPFVSVVVVEHVQMHVCFDAQLYWS